MWWKRREVSLKVDWTIPFLEIYPPEILICRVTGV